MRCAIPGVGLLAALIVFSCGIVPAHAQPEIGVPPMPPPVTLGPPPFPAPAPLRPFQALLQDVNTGIATMAQEVLADNRVTNLTTQGLIVAPLQANIPDVSEDDPVLILIGTLLQEKLMTAMIQFDQQGHLAVVDRLMLHKTVQDMRLDARALRDPMQWPAIGQAMDAQYMLTGSYSVLPVSEQPLKLLISATVRIVHLDTAKAIAASSYDMTYAHTP